MWHGNTKPSVVFDHHIFTDEGWKRARTLAHQILSLKISTCKEDYAQFGTNPANIFQRHITALIEIYGAIILRMSGKNEKSDEKVHAAVMV